MEITATTPKVLSKCLQLFDRPSVAQSSQSKPSTPARYASHPDIQFFSSVKSKHHFAYHQSKFKQAESLSKQEGLPSPYNPFSRSQLVQRLRTYSSLYWAIPYTGDDKLTELDCARAGWVQVNKGLNHLECISCKSHVILRFNDVGSQPKYSVMPLEWADIAAVNARLKERYLEKLSSSAHTRNCPWRNLQCPLRVYYLPPHISTTDEVLVNEYVVALQGVFDDAHIRLFAATLSQAVDMLLPDILPISKQWLLVSYFSESKENADSLIDSKIPRAAYFAAACGWSLETAQYQEKTILVLKCRSCTSKHILQPGNSGVSLTHRNWCLYASEMDGVAFPNYFCNMLIGSERNIGPAGKYQSDTGVEELSLSRKRSYEENVDVNEATKKLSKLSKLYFADPADTL